MKNANGAKHPNKCPRAWWKVTILFLAQINNYMNLSPSQDITPLGGLKLRFCPRKSDPKVISWSIPKAAKKPKKGGDLQNRSK